MSPRDLVLLWTREGGSPEPETTPAPFALYAASQLLESVVEIGDIAARYLHSPEARERAHDHGSSEEELRALTDRHDVARRRLEEAWAALDDVTAEAVRLLGLTATATTTSKPGNGDCPDRPAER